MGIERRAPGWPTVAAAVCIVAVVALWWVVDREAERRDASFTEVRDSLHAEAVYHEDMRVRIIRLLTVLEHADCDDLTELRATVAEMRRDLEQLKPERN